MLYIADAVQISESRRLALGGWADAKQKRRMAMPTLYSDGQLLRQAATKQFITISAGTTFRNWKHEHPTTKPTWEDLFSIWPKTSIPRPADMLAAANIPNDSAAAEADKWDDDATDESSSSPERVNQAMKSH